MRRISRTRLESVGEDEHPMRPALSGLRRSGSLFQRASVAGILPEGRLGSVLSLRQPSAVHTLQVRSALVQRHLTAATRVR